MLRASNTCVVSSLTYSHSDRNKTSLPVHVDKPLRDYASIDTPNYRGRQQEVPERENRGNPLKWVQTTTFDIPEKALTYSLCLCREASTRQCDNRHLNGLSLVQKENKRTSSLPSCHQTARIKTKHVATRSHTHREVATHRHVAVVDVLARGERRIADHEEVETRERDEIDGELAEVRVELTGESTAYANEQTRSNERLACSEERSNDTCISSLLCREKRGL